jgi:hypothetical protein
VFDSPCRFSAPARHSLLAFSTHGDTTVMEIEVKIRLPGPAEHEAAMQLFRQLGRYLGTHEQVNYFLDGTNRSL